MAQMNENDKPGSDARENESSAGEKSREGMKGTEEGTQGSSADGKGSTNEPSGSYYDPNGNQSLRQPEGGSGAGQSRGDESTRNPGTSAGRHEDSEADPIEPSDRDS